MQNQFGIYSAIISKYPVLSAEEERELLVKAKKGNRTAKEKLIFSNLRFVYKIASKSKFSKGVDMEDLLQAGVQGLTEGLARYNLNSEARFLTYAKFHIINAINEGCRKSMEIVIPAKKIGEVNYSFSSFDAPISTDEGSMFLGATLDDGTDFAEDFCRSECEANVRNSLGVLSEKQRRVIREYYGFDGERKSLREIGRELGCAGQYVHELKKNAEETLKKSENLRWYDDGIRAA